jgi:hypothetical protein
MKNTKTVLQYPIFLRCCAFVSDPFWKYVFEDFAYGKAPYGIVIKDDGIYSIVRNKEFSILFHDKTEQDICNEICSMLATKLAILSQKDHQFRRNVCENAYQEILNNISAWNDIKKKKIKDLLIEQFVLNKKQEYQLTLDLAKKLFSIIFVGLQFKTITSKHIVYNFGKIDSIQGIQFNTQQILCHKALLTY